jgi:hypothetical protein
MAPAGEWCPILKPTKQEFEKPFVEYVSKVFEENPDWAMFKVRGRDLPSNTSRSQLLACVLGVES